MTVKLHPFTTTYRTHTCAGLRAADVSKEAKLSGAVDRYHDDGSFDLRDGYGKTRVKLRPDAEATIVALMNSPETPPAQRFTRLTPESVITVTGTVRAREPADAGSPAGAVLLDGATIEILAPAKAPLIFDFNDESISKRDRRRHRYMYLRKPAVHEHLRFRTRMLAEVRRFLVAKGFEEVTTPLLATPWTPDQSDAFISARTRTQVYALPGRRSNLGALLMAGGLDRTFEVSRRFQRRKAYGPFQQPEFTLLDLNVAYVDEADLLALAVALFSQIWTAALGAKAPPPIARLTAEEAWAKYGSETPDLRYPLEIEDVTRAAAQSKVPALRDALMSGLIAAIRVPAAQADKVRGFDLAKPAADFESGTLHQLRLAAAGGTPEVVSGAALSPQGVAELAAMPKAGPGDAVFFVVGRDRTLATLAAGRLRLDLGRALGATQEHALAILTRLPYLQYDAAAGRWTLRGDPLSRPVEVELEGSPQRMHALAFDVVLDGIGIGGGSLRNHDAATQRALFTALGLSPNDVSASYGYMLEAFRFGVPPHGRIGIGVDRLTALLRGLSSIDDVIPMPKNPDGSDELIRCPSPVTKGIARGLFGH